MKLQKVLSCGDKETLQKMVNEFFYSENYVITDDMQIYNTKTNKTLSYKVINKKGRWSMCREV